MDVQKLKGLRQQIDAIDDQIHKLILDRAYIVKKIGLAKEKAQKKPQAPKVPIRPAREAFMLRRLKRQHQGPLPFAPIARIWQEMIAAFTQIQAPYSIGVVLNENNDSLWDMARDQFGAQTPLQVISTPKMALEALDKNDRGVVVLPYPNPTDKTCWWPQLLNFQDIKVLSRLPFSDPGTLKSPAIIGLALAKVQSEPTQNDRSIFIIETHRQTTFEAVTSFWKDHNIAYGPIYQSIQKDAGLFFCDVAGFHQDIIIHPLPDFIRKIHKVGSYPTPLAPLDTHQQTAEGPNYETRTTGPTTNPTTI